MSTATPQAPTSLYREPIAERTLHTASYSGTLTVTRAAGHAGDQLVFVDVFRSAHRLILTREDAADLAATLLEVSGMATSTYGAQFLAESMRDSITRRGVTKARIMRETGIGRHRLDRILSGEVPMTRDELEGIGETVG